MNHHIGSYKILNLLGSDVFPTRKKGEGGKKTTGAIKVDYVIEWIT